MKKQSGRLASLALALVLAMGAGVAWFFLGAILCGAIDTLFRPAYTGGQSEDLVIVHDGTPLVQCSSPSRSTTYRTLDGTPYTERFVRAESKGLIEEPFASRQQYANMNWHQRVQVVVPNWHDEYWYFVHNGQPKGHGYLVGYSKKTRLPIGYIGRGGFRPNEPPADEWFSVEARRVFAGSFYGVLRSASNADQAAEQVENLPSTSAAVFFFAMDDGVVLVDFESRMIRPLWTGADFVAAGEMRGSIAVRTPNYVHLVEPGSNKTRSYRLPKGVWRYGTIRIWALPDNGLLVGAFEHAWTKGELFWLDASGKVTRRESIDLHVESPPRWISRQTENLVISVLAIPSPGAILSGLVWDAWQCDDWGRLRRKWLEWQPGLIAVWLISIVLAVLCYRRQRRYALPWTGMWVGFVLLFGVPAYIGYLVHRHWPARLPCPHCGHVVPQDREACCVCGQAFPPPAAKGIEVFA